MKWKSKWANEANNIEHWTCLTNCRRRWLEHLVIKQCHLSPLRCVMSWGEVAVISSTLSIHFPFVIMNISSDTKIEWDGEGNFMNCHGNQMEGKSGDEDNMISDSFAFQFWNLRSQLGIQSLQGKEGNPWAKESTDEGHNSHSENWLKTSLLISIIIITICRNKITQVQLFCRHERLWGIHLYQKFRLIKQFGCQWEKWITTLFLGNNEFDLRKLEDLATLDI